MKDTCKGCGAVGTCEVSDTAVHEAQDACGNYTYFRDNRYKSINF